MSSGKISNFPAGSGLVQFFESEQQLKNMMSNVISKLETGAKLKKINIDVDTISRTEAHYKTENIQYKYYDVYEFEEENYCNYLSTTVEKLKEEGLRVKINSEVVSIYPDHDTSCFTVTAKESEGTHQYLVKNLVLATGSIEVQEKLISMSNAGVKTSFEIGVRVEAETVALGDSLNTHGDLKLKYGTGRTYCATKDGAVISYRTDGMNFLEGYIDSKNRTNFSNLAILVKCDDANFLTDFSRLYREKFSGVPVMQKYTDYIKGKVSEGILYTTLPIAKRGEISTLFSDEINQSIKDFLKHVLIEAMHLDGNKLTLIAPELKLLRNPEISDRFEIASNLFVVGAATGKFRGILQSICSGIRCGQYILGR